MCNTVITVIVSVDTNIVVITVVALGINRPLLLACKSECVLNAVIDITYSQLYLVSPIEFIFHRSFDFTKKLAFMTLKTQKNSLSKCQMLIFLTQLSSSNAVWLGLL